MVATNRNKEVVETWKRNRNRKKDVGSMKRIRVGDSMVMRNSLI